MNWFEYQDTVRIQARKHGIPAFGTFELTPLCNFSCRMCYVRLSPERLKELGRLRTAEEWVDMARQARDAGMVGVTLTGGEVLTRRDFPEIYKNLVEQGFMVSVLSNGALADEGIAQLFSELPPAHLRFTLYGSSNKTYERLCGATGGFDRVINNLRQLKELGVLFSIAFTETTENVDDVEEVARIAAGLDAPLVVGTKLVPAVRGARSEGERLQVEHAVLPANAQNGIGRASAPRDVYANTPFARCRAYRNSFWIDWNGDMELCGFMSSCRARPFEIGFAPAWEDLLSQLAKRRFPQPCLSCEDRGICSACPGVLEAETGAPERVCERICSAVHDLSSRARQGRGVAFHEEELCEA